MSADKRYDIRPAAVKVPGDERHGGVKIVLLHLGQQSRVVQMPVGLDKPGVIDGEVCIPPREMPRPVPGRRPEIHEKRCGPFGKNCRKIRDRFGGRKNRCGSLCYKKEGSSAGDVLDENRKVIRTIGNFHDGPKGCVRRALKARLMRFKDWKVLVA